MDFIDGFALYYDNKEEEPWWKRRKKANEVSPNSKATKLLKFVQL